MRRRRANILAAVSLFLCLLFVLVWVGSFFAVTNFYYVRPYGASDQRWGLEITTHRMGIRVILSRTRLMNRAYEAESGFGGSVTHGGTGYDIYRDQRKTFRSFGRVLWWGETFGVNDQGGTPGVVEEGPHYEVIVSLWVLALVAAVLPLVWLVKAHRRRRTVREGGCANCGYDLRATPGRCPECGEGAGEDVATGSRGRRAPVERG